METKGKTTDFSETIVVYDIKAVRHSQLNGYMSFYEYQRSRFFEGHSDSTFSNFYSLETTRPIEAKFYVEPPWNEGMKVNKNGLCHMTKMVAMPIYGKNL